MTGPEAGAPAPEAPENLVELPIVADRKLSPEEVLAVVGREEDLSGVVVLGLRSNGRYFWMNGGGVTNAEFVFLLEWAKRDLIYQALGDPDSSAPA